MFRGEYRGQPSRRTRERERKRERERSTLWARVTSNASQKRDRVDPATGLLMAECHEKPDDKSIVRARDKSTDALLTVCSGCTDADAPRRFSVPFLHVTPSASGLRMVMLMPRRHGGKRHRGKSYLEADGILWHCESFNILFFFQITDLKSRITENVVINLQFIFEL